MKHKNSQQIFLFREFTRKFTRHLGLLTEKPYDPALNLVESRILYEVQRHPKTRAKDLELALDVNKGYLSRVLTQLQAKKLLRIKSNSRDKREKHLELSARGNVVFKRMNQVSQNRAEGLLQGLGPVKAKIFISGLSAAEMALDAKDWVKPEDIVLRPLRPGDLGWVISRHGELYAEEWGWNQDFEILVADIALGFMKKHDTSCEKAWIAEAHGVRLGCIFLVKESKTVAKLRILLVEPTARGLGVGSRLVKECLSFAKKCKYKKITLWTNDILVSARRIYEAEGFVLEKEERHFSFGKNLVGQYWAKSLDT